MSLDEKIAKLKEKQLGIELTDEEVSKANGGCKEITICRYDVTLEAYLKWADGGKCNNCHSTTKGVIFGMLKDNVTTRKKLAKFFIMESYNKDKQAKIKGSKKEETP